MESIKKERRDHDSWLDQYEGGSRIQAKRAWRFWTVFMGDKTEKWILDNLHSEDWAQHLVNFRRRLKQQPKERGEGTLADNTTKTIANLIRAYFEHVGATVSLSKKQKEELIKVESTPNVDFPMNIRVKEQVMRVASPVEDYIVCAGISFGLRTNDFLKVTRGQLEPFMDQEVPIQLPAMQTQKRGVKAYPFIDRDAYEAIRKLLQKMDLKGRIDPDERMLKFTTKDPDGELNRILKDLFKRANINNAGMIVRFHILRKFLTDQLSGICSSDKWKWFVGKKTKSPYVSSEGKDIYKRVMEFTGVNHRNVISADTSKLTRRIDNLEYELGRTSGLLEILIKDVLTQEQRDHLRKISKEHFGDEYPESEVDEQSSSR